MSKIEIDDLDISPISIKPTLYDINKSFDVIATDRYNGVKGEQNARMVLFTNFILGGKPVILMGSRASGKSNILNIVGVYAKNPQELSASSEKAYQRNTKINKATHFIIPEVNKIHEKTVEMLKDFGEGAKHNYTFLNIFKEPETITLDPKPFVTSIADENKNFDALGEELISRLTIVRTDSSVDQNIAVIEEKLKRAQNPNYKRNMSQEEVRKLIEYVKNLPDIQTLKFIYPAGTTIRSAIPPLFTDSRRDTDKYLANTYGIALFYIHDRMTIDIGENTYVLVTPADIWYNHRIFEDVLVESSLKCGKIEKEILEILKDFGEEARQDSWGNKVVGLKASEIHGYLLKRNYTPSIESVNKYCNNLMEIGYILRHEEVRPHRFSLNPELKREYKVFINWLDVIEECKRSVKELYPAIADEYIKRYCEGDGLVVIDPFTGEKKNILESYDYYREQDLKTKVVKEDKPIEVQIVKTSEQKKEIVKPFQQNLGVIDNKDKIQKEVLTLLDDNLPHKFEEFLAIGEDSVVEDVLNYLIKIGEVFKDGTNYQILR